MTASLARNGKGKAVLGRCLTATTFPQRHQRRVSEIRTPGAAPWGAALLPCRGTGGRVERVGSATASFLHLVRRPAKNAAQHIAQPFCPVAPSVFGSAHERNHEGSHDREVVNLCQGFGNVCRA